MTWLRSRRFLAAAYEWKRERAGRLQAEVRILETLLESTRQELADTRQLEGEKLALVFGSLTADEVQETMRESREFQSELEEIFLAGEHNLKAKGCAA